MAKSPISLEERFWLLVTKTPSCWLWNGRLNHGYGRFSTGVLAHRFAYELLVGPIPPGLQLDHLCHVRNCVNPDHLEPVTSTCTTTLADVLRAREALVLAEARAEARGLALEEAALAIQARAPHWEYADGVARDAWLRAAETARDPGRAYPCHYCGASEGSSSHVYGERKCCPDCDHRRPDESEDA